MKFSKKSDLFGKELYSILVKDHIYFDGNKRLAAILFLEFLNRNHALLDEEKNMVLSNDALVAITLMIAESKPQEKEMMVDIVMNLLVPSAI